MENKKTPTAAEIAEHLTYSDAEEVAQAYLDLGITASEDAEEIAQEIEEAYAGNFGSDEDFAQDMAEQIGAIDKNAKWPHNCIDWEFAAKELMYDYSEESGYYFRNC